MGSEEISEFEKLLRAGEQEVPVGQQKQEQLLQRPAKQRGQKLPGEEQLLQQQEQQRPLVSPAKQQVPAKQRALKFPAKLRIPPLEYYPVSLSYFLLSFYNFFIKYVFLL